MRIDLVEKPLRFAPSHLSCQDALTATWTINAPGGKEPTWAPPTLNSSHAGA